MSTTTLNAHRVFVDSVNGDHFLEALNISSTQENKLRDARDEVRREIQSGVAGWQGFIDKRALFEDAVIGKAETLPTLRPKFRMQGSAKYFTLNDPAHKPPQQIDYDDGVYLPVSYIIGTSDPMVSSAGFFRLIEDILQPVCNKRGWILNPQRKDSCVRVQISKSAHIDLPLYAIADDEYQELVEMAASTGGLKVNVRDSIELADVLYANVREDKIRLAHRKKGWISSDPRAIENWFNEAIKTHGRQLRHVSRYLKGWRDYQWEGYRLSSITLMKCAVDAFDKLAYKLDEKRDDVALLEVARVLPEMFGGNIANPVMPGQVLNDNWTAEDRSTYVQAARDLVAFLEHALSGTSDPVLALNDLKTAFGDRITDDATAIVVASAQAQVFQYQRAKVAAPAVPKTTSG